MIQIWKRFSSDFEIKFFIYIDMFESVVAVAFQSVFHAKMH
jgi:hypothetical protein